MKSPISRHNLSHFLWYTGIIAVSVFAPIGLKQLYPPKLQINQVSAMEECTFRVSRTGNIYSPENKYYGMTSHMTNLCKNQAEEISARIKITIEN